MAKKSLKNPKFELTLMVGKETYSSKGETFSEAAHGFKTGKLGGKIWLFIHKDGKKYPFAFSYLKWQLLLAKPARMAIFEKKVNMFFK